MSNHKWKDNVCVKCGLHRILKKWSRCMAIVNHPPYDVMAYGKDWWYGKDHRFNRPNCEPQKQPI
jgi:hypothetical protein